MEAVRYICPDAPAQVTATWDDMSRDECPWCHRPLISHDHHLWSIVTGTAQSDSNTESKP